MSEEIRADAVVAALVVEATEAVALSEELVTTTCSFPDVVVSTLLELGTSHDAHFDC